MWPATTSIAAWTEPTAAATSSRVYGSARAGRSWASRNANSHSITIGGKSAGSVSVAGLTCRSRS